MTITPTYIAIGRMFEQNFLFEVPKYQRYYAWEPEQVNDFIKDLDGILADSEKDHFFGGIVCVSKKVDGSTRQQKELIDGQQRLTTSILLIINLIRKYEELLNVDTLSEDDKKIVKSRIDKLNEKYINYNDEINRKPIIVHKLVLSLADKDFFEGILNGRPIEPERDSHEKIKKANQLLEKFVRDKLNQCTEDTEKIDVLAKIEHALQANCTVIFMDCDSRDSAYKLFQVLNDRGAGLNEGDLLKSKTLEALEKFPEEQEQAQKCWDEILEEDPSKVENFLRTYYASCYGKRAGRASLYDDFLKVFFPGPFNGNLPKTKQEANDLLIEVQNILAEIRIYRKITAGEWPYPEEQPVTGWDRNRLQVLVTFLSYDITLPLLLAATKLKQKKYADLVHMLEKFMFRYKTICNNPHQVLSELYNKEAKEIRRDPDNYSLSSLSKALQKLLEEKANDEKFKVGLKNLAYQPSGGNKSLRYFFSTLCDYYRWHKEGEHGNPCANKEHIINYDNVTIEHIDSQHAQDGNTLPKESLNKLKNLTILSRDDNGNRVGNKPFAEKKETYAKSCYKINGDLAKYDAWQPDEATEWENYLVDFGCIIFVVK